MKFLIAILTAATLVSGCDRVHEVDETPPASPRGITTISLDNAIQLNWLHNTEPDLDGYRVWVSDRYDGRYVLIATTTKNEFVDRGAKNGTTYYYGLTAFDFVGNESLMSKDVVYDTPRPEGFNIRLNNFRQLPNASGYDFSTYSVGPYDDDYTDVYYEFANGRSYLNVWSDTDIQGMGYTRSLDDISVAPTSGWAPSKSVEAIPGHTYILWTWDDHYAKMRVTDVRSTHIVFDWAYQTAKGNPELRKSAGNRVRQIRPMDEKRR